MSHARSVMGLGNYVKCCCVRPGNILTEGRGCWAVFNNCCSIVRRSARHPRTGRGGKGPGKDTWFVWEGRRIRIPPPVPWDKCDSDSLRTRQLSKPCLPCSSHPLWVRCLKNIFRQLSRSYLLEIRIMNISSVCDINCIELCLKRRRDHLQIYSYSSWMARMTKVVLHLFFSDFPTKF